MRIDEIESGKRAGEFDLPRSVEGTAAVVRCGWNDQNDEGGGRECGANHGRPCASLRIVESMKPASSERLRGARFCCAATHFSSSVIRSSRSGPTRSGKP